MDVTPSNFINLDRRFRQQSGKHQADDAAAESYLSSWGHSYLHDWPKLLQMPGIHVVLGEAGSGRTWEFKAKANELRASGCDAYFLSLHKLATMDVSQVMDTEDYQRLRASLEQESDVWFFLDAVDESKLLRVSQFREALDKFAGLIRPGRGQARIFISSRVKDWLPETDRRHVLEALDAVIAPAQSEDDSAEEDDSESKQKSSAVHVWTIAPLNKEQVKRYVEGHGVVDSASFIHELDSAYAWELASRPLDVNLLVSYWLTEKRIGRPAEMFEHVITEQLKERPDKAEYEREFPLEPGKAREGAETLAAATIFCRRLDFKIEDDRHLTAGGGLDARACLPVDWQPAAIHALLSRRLFDTAIYGCTRFHHRSFAEYLAAHWFMRLLARECPTDEVLGQLFALTRGQWQARQTRLPVAVWLACLGTGFWVHEVRERLLQTSPEAFFRYGDPSQLPIEFKERILDAVVSRYGARSTVRFEISDVTLSRMGEPALAAALVRHLESPSVSGPLKAELVTLARVAHIHAAVPVVLSSLHLGADDDKYYHNYGLRLVEDLGTPLQLQEVTAWAMSLPTISGGRLGQLVDMLFPRFLSPAQFGELLARLEAREDKSFTLKYSLSNTCTALSAKEVITETLQVLLPLIQQPPCYIPTVISSTYAWLGPPLRALLRNLLSSSLLNEAECKLAARALWVSTQEGVDRDSDYEGLSSERKNLTWNEATQNHPSVRREAFWLHYHQEKQRREQRDAGSLAFWAWHHCLDFSQISSADIEWMWRDMEESDEKRAALFRFTVDYWLTTGRRHQIKSKIQSSIRGHKELEAFFARSSRPQWIGTMCYWWHKQKWHGIRSPYWWKNRFNRIKKAYWRVYNTLWLRWNLNSIRRGERPGTLYKILRQHGGGNSTRWAVTDWKKLTQQYGKRVTEAVQEGCVSTWKKYDPDDAETFTTGTVPGLTGLQHIWRTNQCKFDQLTPAEAEKATRYAFMEMNGFSVWLPELAKNHPQSVLRIVEARIVREWPLAEGRQSMNTLEKVHWSKSHLGNLLAPFVLALFQTDDPPSSEALHTVLSFLVRHSEAAPASLAALASSRIHRYELQTAQHHSWLFIWLQTETLAALEYFEGLVSCHRYDQDQARKEAVLLCAALTEHREWNEPVIASPDYQRPEVASHFIRWVYRWISQDTDLHHPEGSYTPVPRDDAQNLRGHLLTTLAATHTAEAESALISLFTAPELESHRDYMLHLHETQARNIADGFAWKATAIRTFEVKHLAEPMNVADLFAVGCRRLQHIKDKVERPDNIQISSYVRPDSDEAVVRRFLAMKLSDLNQGHYTAPQEAVIHGELRPDLRLENPSIRGAVPIEVKVADDRSINDLLDDLERQLVDDYLSSYASRHGIFVVAFAGRRLNDWQRPGTRQMLPFQEMICLLQQRADELLKQAGRALGLAVIGIDFRECRSARLS